MLSRSDAIAKLNVQVDGEEETIQKCQSRRIQPEEEIPCGARHVPWNEGLYDEWWRREAGREEEGGI